MGVAGALPCETGGTSERGVDIGTGGGTSEHGVDSGVGGSNGEGRHP
jgi:hypothetical protein